jgi:hypothetical protein
VAPKVEPENRHLFTPAGVRPPLPLLTAALVAGLCAIAPGIYLGGLHVRRGAEIIDHVIPGLVVIAIVGIAMLWGHRSMTVMALAGLGVLIAGLFMVLAHVGLFRQAVNHQVAWGGAAYHCSTAALVFLVGLAWAWRYRAGLAG